MSSYVSVIIPCYNGWQYMKKCLESLENQTVPPYEVIVVDDCSTDDSYFRLMEFSRRTSLNFVVLKNEINMGPGISRKNAVDVSQGEYIAFCDCDDWYELDFVESITDVIEKENASVIIYDNYLSYDNRRIVAGAVNQLKNEKKTILANIWMSLCRIVVKREIVRQVEFPHLYYGEDGAVVPQIIAKSTTFSLVDKPLYNYYFRTGSASQKPLPEACAQMVMSFEIVKQNLPEEYRKECEYIGIKRVCYGAVLCGFKSGVAYAQINEILDSFEEEFPEWFSNSYKKNYGKIKNLYLWLVRRRYYFFIRIMSWLHSYYVKLRKK